MGCSGVILVILFLYYFGCLFKGVVKVLVFVYLVYWFCFFWFFVDLFGIFIICYFYVFLVLVRVSQQVGGVCFVFFISFFNSVFDYVCFIVYVVFGFWQYKICGYVVGFDYLDLRVIWVKGVDGMYKGINVG